MNEGANTEQDTGKEEDKVFHLNVRKRFRPNVLCILFPFVAIFIVIVAVVTWSISNALHTATEDDLITSLGQSEVQSSLRRINSNILSDGKEIAIRAGATAQVRTKYFGGTFINPSY